eukprot:1143192-Pelagomonas_calceolata.AAC.10
MSVHGPRLWSGFKHTSSKHKMIPTTWCKEFIYKGLDSLVVDVAHKHNMLPKAVGSVVTPHIGRDRVHDGIQG